MNPSDGEVVISCCRIVCSESEGFESGKDLPVGFPKSF